MKKTLRTCPQGHQYYKSSDCPTCPFCANEKKPTRGFLTELSAPARRALQSAGIRTIEQLAAHTEKDLLTLHGFGPASLPILRKILHAHKLSFKK